MGVNLRFVTHTGRGEPKRLHGPSEISFPTVSPEWKAFTKRRFVDLYDADTGRLQIVDLVSDGERDLPAGVGARLIEECINFSKRNRYQNIKLWTQSNLLEARHLYTKAGFEMVSESAHKSFGQDLIAQKIRTLH